MAKMTAKQKKGMINALLLSITLVLGAGVAATLLLLPQTAAGQSALVGLKQLFASDSTQIWWYVTRSAGIIAYMLLWFSTVYRVGAGSSCQVPQQGSGANLHCRLS